MNITGKKISVIGAVKSGIGAAKLIKRLGGIPFVSDNAPAEKIRTHLDVLEAEKINYECGGHTDRVYDCEFLITSPGVPSEAAVLLNAKARGLKVYSEVEFASWFCKGKIIAITGTNGKTTTTSLCAHMLNECGIKTYAAGNIGTAFSEIVLDVKVDEYVALETSSFQLDHIEKFKPHFSMILNITPDHMDRYNNDFSLYVASKMGIVKNQSAEDYFIYNADEPNTFTTMRNNAVQTLGFSVAKELTDGSFLSGDDLLFARSGKSEVVCRNSDLSIKGEHNTANALAVLSVAKTLALPNIKIREAFSSFKGVEHRLEFVRILDGVTYINDSKATNVDSVWYALRSFEQPINLILGGKDKGNDYERIKDLVIKNVKKIYAIGSSAQKVYDFFHELVPTEIKSSMEECVQSARREALDGSILLLSPACASFDMFNDYEHRGRVFKEAVKGLK